MSRLLPFLLALLLGVPAWAQEEPTPQDPAAQTPETPQEPEPQPRVVGQARTQPEIDAWNAIGEASPDLQIQLTQQFLKDFPDSGLTPYAHYTLANIYRQRDDIPNFMLHGEKALEELPNLPDILAYLAFFYSEQGEQLSAIQYAQKSLELLDAMSQPPQLTAAAWASRKFQLSGEAHYSIGRVHLARASTGEESTPDDPELAQAVEHLQKALDLAPEHPYASFRLAEVYTRQQQFDKAIEAYALTVAMGGMIGDFARPKLQTVYEHVHKNTDGMEDVINQQQELLTQRKTSRHQILEAIAEEERLAQEAAAKEAAAKESSPPTEEPPSQEPPVL
jgi:tetratricopeptide (TPR) repeat protein